MTRSDACRAARIALAAGGAPDPHVRQCVACSAFAARLRRVDAALEQETQLAVSAPISPALRARILERTGRRPRPLDLGLRVAGIAAVLVAAVAFVPDALAAAEIDVVSVEIPSLGLDPSLADPRAALDALAESPPIEVPGLGAAGAAGAALLVAGIAFAVRRSRP